MTKLERCDKLASIIQAGATIGALILGAIWFAEQRQNYPRAQLQQSIDVLPVGPGLIAIEARAQFQNSGMVRVELNHARIKLQNVSPEPYDYATLSRLQGAAYWGASRPGQPDQGQFRDGELRWPVLKQFDGPINNEIEPGETDVLVFTFLMTCKGGPTDSYTKLHWVRIASDIFKPAGTSEQGFAWKARDFVDVSDACSGKGSKK